MPYQTVANKIIKESIKSAVFIDENALPFYSETSPIEIYEETLSKELYENFKSIGITLAIQKFEVGNEEDIKLKHYLFNSRDLVLLDWKLNGNEGEEFSLKLLSDVVIAEHINFCVIYTSEFQTDNIYANIITYFSGKSVTDYEKIKGDFEAYEDELKPIFEKFNLFDNSVNEPLIKKILELGADFKSSLDEIDKNICEAFRHLKIAFSQYHKSPKSILYSIGSFENRTLLINNTIVTIVNKDSNNSSKDALIFIERFSSNIIKTDFSYTHLLGLELKNKLLATGAYIDSEFFNVKKETLAFHRKQILDEYKSDLSFRELLKNVYLEQASLKLSNTELQILDSKIFDAIDSADIPKASELAAMNVYYNSLKLKTDDKKLDFGDVFIDENKSYYLCITALCDCIRPSKTDYIFYFAKGTSMTIDTAIQLGDTAFISFISKDKAVVWSNIDKVEVKEKEAKQLDLEQFKYKPVYIKPITYLVENPSIIENKINLARIYQYENKKGDLEFMELQYVTTIKPTYAQRISNHAFTHPIRIGVDFVKKN
ncbi:hypothetical protein MASR2M69_08420 [Bacteroidota bacterium]